MNLRIRRALGFEVLESRFLMSATLVLSTSGDVVGAGSLADQNWSGREALDYGGSEFRLEPGTTHGTFSPWFDPADLGFGGASIDALHYVAEDIVVAGIRLGEGAILFSTETAATFDGFAAAPADVVLFTPDGPDSYNSGTFTLLIDGSDIGINSDVNAISLVTRDVDVGGRLLSAGSFVLAGVGIEPVGRSPSIAVTSRDVIVLEATALGTNTVGVTSFLLDGRDAGLDREISGIHLATETGLIAGRSIAAGSLLVSLGGADSAVGTNRIDVAPQDIFELAVAQAGADTVAAASLWFEGRDVNMNSPAANIDGLALRGLTASNAPPTTEGIADVAVSHDAPDTSIDLFSVFDDAEDGDADLSYTVSGNTQPSLFSQVAIDEESGTLKLDYAASPFGVSEITVRATDRGGAFVETVFQVTVNYDAASPDAPDAPTLPWVSDPDDLSRSPTNRPSSGEEDSPGVPWVGGPIEAQEGPLRPQNGRPDATFGSGDEDSPSVPWDGGPTGAKEGPPRPQTGRPDSTFRWDVRADTAYSSPAPWGSTSGEFQVSLDSGRETPADTLDGPWAEASKVGASESMAMTPRDAPTSPKDGESNQANSANAASSVHPGESGRSLLRQASDAILSQWGRDSDLSGLTALWQALDDLATQTGRQERRATAERVVVSGIGGALTVGYVVWSVPRGCLLALTGTSTPLWRNWDVLSVLSVDSKRRGPVKENPPAKEGPESVLG